jgi:hypothetical protein
MTRLMGFQGQLLYGTAGSTATTVLTGCRDIKIPYSNTRAPSHGRGDGSAPPIVHERVTERKIGITFTMINNTADTALAALRVAAAAGTAVALRGRDYSAGMGFDGDFTLDMENGQPLAGEQTLDFTASPTDEAGRTLVPYA